MKSLMRVALALTLVAAVGCTKSSDDDGDDGSEQGASFSDPQLQAACELRIINGDTCPSGEGPIALLVASDPLGRPIASCSGAFISRDRVLTAAHCAELAALGSVTVYTGDLSAGVVSITPDSRYNEADPSARIFDSAVAILSEEVDVNPLPLFVSGSLSVGDTIYVYGFGIDENNQSAIDRGLGNAAKRATMLIAEHESGIVIAEFDTLQMGACEGDSGGPVIARNPDGLFGIVAVVSGGTTVSCQAGTVEVFDGVRTPGSVDFITSLAPGVGLI